MTDDKKAPDDLGEIDWDSALSDWGDNFVPEVAKDVVTDKPASLSGQSVSRPLYRPPAVPPQKPKVPPPAPRPVVLPPTTTRKTARRSSARFPASSFAASRCRRRPRGARPKPARRPGRRRARGGGPRAVLLARRPARRRAHRTTSPSAKSATRAEGRPSRRRRYEPRTGCSAASRALRRRTAAPSGRPEAAGARGRRVLDAFAEPRPEQLTIPAESEIGRFPRPARRPAFANRASPAQASQSPPSSCPPTASTTPTTTR